MIVIAAWGLGEVTPSTGRFSRSGVLPSHWSFSSAPERLNSPYCYLKWDRKWINSQGDVKKIFCLWRLFLWEYAIQKLLTTPHAPTPHPPFNRISRVMSPTYWKNPNGKSWRVQVRVLVGFQEAKPNFFCFLMPLRQLNGLQWH